MAGIFKAYDVRGIYPTELDEKMAYGIARAAAGVLGIKRITVGRDVRRSAPAVHASVVEGLVDSGVDVEDIGLASSPMHYFAVGHYGTDGGVQVTASHNPPDYIGLKFCRRGAVPVSYETGIGEIERAYRERSYPSTGRRGEVSFLDITGAYRKHLLRFAGGVGPLRLVADAGNGMAGVDLPIVFDGLPCELLPLYFEPDGSFPHHPPNPQEGKNLADLIAKVIETGAALGAGFDGDADRVAFVDERGERVLPDFIFTLIALDYLKTHPGATFVIDFRMSRVVTEEIERAGGKVVRWKVGHSYLKAKLREVGGLFGGELAGHFYYKENYFADSSAITLLKVLKVLSAAEKPFSEVVRPLRRYWSTGEVNFRVADKGGKLKEVEAAFPGANVERFDGIWVVLDDFWFALRPSNTEPLLRFSLEARDRAVMERMREKVEGILTQ